MTSTIALADGQAELPRTAQVTSTLTGLTGHSTLIRFIVAGALSFAVNQVLLFLLYEHVLGAQTLAGGALRHFDAGLFAASAIALEVSILVRFGLNDTWTFRHRREKRFQRRLLESNLSSLASPAIALAAVNLLTPLLGISYLLANAIGIAIGFAWNWTWSNRVVWRQVPALPAEIAVTR